MKKRKTGVMVLAVAAVLTSQLAFAASTWTDARTWELTSGDDFKTVTTTGTKCGATKTTDQRTWDVYTVSKTMWTNPTARLVNSANQVRSDVVTTANVGRYVTGQQNTGTIGYAEYLSVKPAFNQVGYDTIKLQFRNY